MILKLYSHVSYYMSHDNQVIWMKCLTTKRHIVWEESNSIDLTILFYDRTLKY